MSDGGVAGAMAPFDPIAWWARRTPGRVALVDRVAGGRHTWEALDAMAGAWADRLEDAGVRAGDRVAVLAGNRVEVLVLLAACARLGAALVPLNWRLAAPELRAVLADARPALVVAEAAFETWRDAVPGVAWLAIEWAPGGGASARPRVVPVPAPDAPALILYTSGSTGRPKGAMLPHRQLLANAIATVTAWQLGAGDVAPITTPLFHTGGWNVFALPLWWCGGCVVLGEPFDAASFLEALAHEGCTVAFVVPTQLVMLADAPAWGRALPRLRWFIAGGAPCPEAVASRVRAAGYALREGFGLTEFGPNCFGTTDAMARERPGRVGWPVPFVEARLVDEAGADVPDGVVGELLLRGPQAFAGYLGDPVRTAEARSPEGWVRTGDLAERDGDGTYRIRGRRKEMYISGGENVYPGEVEAALCSCDGVAEAAVVAVPHARWGEVGHAFVRARPGAALDAATLLAGARDRLAGYKVPKGVTLVDDLPRTGAGKVDRVALAVRARAGVAEG